LYSLKKGNDIRTQAYRLSLTLPRFSLLATLSLGIIGITGVYMAWLQLYTLDSLFTTQYGLTLIAKLSAALPMVLLGGYHQVKLHKGIIMMASIGSTKKKGNTLSEATVANHSNNAISKFSKTIKIESLIGIGVLFVASLLTITSPPSMMAMMQQFGYMSGMDMSGGMPMTNTNGSSSSTSNSISNNNNYLQKATINGIDTTLEILPFNVGFNNFTVTLFDPAEGKAPQNINAVFLRFTNAEGNIGPIVATLNKSPDGTYSSFGGYLSQAGNWKIDLVVQRIKAYDLNHSFDANLNATTNGTSSSSFSSSNTNNTSATTTATTNANNMNNMDMNMAMTSSPPFDFFAWLAVIMSIIVGAGSAYFFQKSRWQLQDTIELLKEDHNE
jgi:copper transport protein